MDNNNNWLVFETPMFDLRRTLECGQCFRYSFEEDTVRVFAGDRCALFRQEGDRLLVLASSEEEAREFWADYFDLSVDYGEIVRHISRDDVIEKACEFGSGIRIARQDPWEMLVTFIISQQNNIPRIKKIVDELCTAYGEEHEFFGQSYYGFPGVAALSAATPEQLERFKMGYRGEYIIDAAAKVASGQVDLSSLEQLPFAEAKAELKKIKGVGEKVANCILLYGARRIEAFPIDVWIHRSIIQLYGGNLDVEKFAPYGGIAQQYLFYYARHNLKPPKK